MCSPGPQTVEPFICAPRYHGLLAFPVLAWLSRCAHHNRSADNAECVAEQGNVVVPDIHVCCAVSLLHNVPQVSDVSAEKTRAHVSADHVIDQESHCGHCRARQRLRPLKKGSGHPKMSFCNGRPSHALMKTATTIMMCSIFRFPCSPNNNLNNLNDALEATVSAWLSLVADFCNIGQECANGFRGQEHCKSSFISQKN